MLPVDAAAQQQAQSVGVEVGESAADALDLLDGQVDGFGGAVERVAGGKGKYL